MSIKIKGLCPRSGSHRKVKQNDKLRPVQDSGSLAVFKVTARDQGHYKGPSGAFVTYCNISCCFFFKKRGLFPDDFKYVLNVSKDGFLMI